MITKVLSRLALAAIAFPVLAQTPSTKLEFEPLVRRALPDCEGTVKLTEVDIKMALPAGFVGKAFQAKSEPQSHACEGQHAAILSPRGRVYVGNPWPLKQLQGTPVERMREFALQALGAHLTPNIGSQKNEDGLLPVELVYTTEGGKVAMPGWVDEAGTTFFPGHFYPASGKIGPLRLEKIAPLLQKSPTRGKADAKVTLIEFSDFQCPSCKVSTRFVNPLLEKYGDRIRYIRVDFPLVTAHPWAMGAAIIGRAIYQQNPEAFWKFKEAVYQNQSSLNLFTLEDFARGFVTDHDLNLESFNTAIASEETRKQILDSLSAGNAIQVVGTPTFLVNGVLVNPGENGKHLAARIEQALSNSVVSSQ